MNTRWITDPETGELYFAIGPFANTGDAVPVQRVVMSCVGHPSYPKMEKHKLHFEDGTITQMGRAMLWLEGAGENGLSTQLLAEKLGFAKEAANGTLQRLLKAGYVEKIPRVKGQHLFYRAVT